MLRPATLPQIISTLFVMASAAEKAEVQCPAECSCSLSPPPCPPGVSWVTDHCGCCKICARQFNEDCSATEPCDHIKGLRCHLGAGGDPERGLCRAEAHGLPCSFNGLVYQHGENFQPICQHQCTCMNGVVGCMPLCPYQLTVPQWRCSRPRLTRVKGGCCEKWVCDDDNHISEKSQEVTPTSLPDSQPHPNHIRALLQPWHLVTSGGEPLGEMGFFPTSEGSLQPRCIPQTSEWTQCSTTCGMGFSSRVTNENPDCQLVRENRLCKIQHCGAQLLAPRKGKKCQRTMRPQEPVRIIFAGCSTARRYRPRTCGLCTDSRCCTPSLSRTVRLRFSCPDGDKFYNIMWIQHCNCKRSCHTDHRLSDFSLSLYNDIHTFRD
ncbi:cellular communication network factor 1, like 2 [Melanotaenia boesemani]|uniref:cellular communication network factor 1, like 2 n=1 Tax=Melanotaenia boesemani TaxID=1250792 RepID=UPI001C057B4E|nr:cellular communication network factor 1, like 2 [Melanotaenia boesemani]